MRRNQFVRIILLTVLGLFFVASINQAREVKGITKSFCRHLVASAVATDGSAVTDPVTIVKQVRLASGKIFYIGRYSLEVPEGQKVMMVFQKVRANGTLKPKTVARFAADNAGLSETTQFTVTAQMIGGSLAIDLGKINVRHRIATSQLNPLEDVDNDDDGISDLDDNDDDNDGIEDNQDEDEDGDGVIDQDENMDTDDDGAPNVVDADDDNDGCNLTVNLGNRDSQFGKFYIITGINGISRLILGFHFLGFVARGLSPEAEAVFKVFLKYFPGRVFFPPSPPVKPDLIL